MEHRTYRIADGVFSQFPGYRRGVVLAYEVRNGPSPAELLSRLRAEEVSARGRLNAETLTSEPRLASWREAFRRLGYKPGDFRPSIEALLRRVLRGQELPSINALVDIGNIVSLHHLLPVGGHAIDQSTGDIALRPAVGTESFTAFGTEEAEHPFPGEFILAEGDQVLTRRWIWRQANHTLTLPGTTAIEFNLDALPPVNLPDIEAAAGDLSDLVGRFCGGRTSLHVLSRQSPSMTL